MSMQPSIRRFLRFPAARFLPLLAVSGLLLFFPLSGKAQQIFFCESVDKEGKPSGTSNTFSIAPKGSYLNVLVKLPAPAGTTRIIYDLYAVDSLGQEKFESTTSQDIPSEWTWFHKGFTFYRPGQYAVYVYDDSEKLLVAGKLILVRK